jgi:hypothetical protein
MKIILLLTVIYLANADHHVTDNDITFNSSDVILHLDGYKYTGDLKHSYLDNNRIRFKLSAGRHELIFQHKFDILFTSVLVLRNLQSEDNSGSYDKKSVQMATIIFFISIIIIILLTVYILFNLERIKKWWHRRSRHYFSHPEELPHSASGRDRELS